MVVGIVECIVERVRIDVGCVGHRVGVGLVQVVVLVVQISVTNFIK